MNFSLPALTLLFSVYSLPAVMLRFFDGVSMSAYMQWMTFGTAAIFVLYGLRCKLAKPGQPVRKWALVTALVALVLVVRLALEFARVGYVVMKGSIDFEDFRLQVLDEELYSDDAQLEVLANLFTFKLTGLSFFWGAAGVCLAVFLTNCLIRKGAVLAGMDAFAPFGALMVILFRLGQISEPQVNGRLLPRNSPFAHFPYALEVAPGHWVWAVCILSAVFALVWAVVSFLISLRRRSRTGLNFTLTLFFLCVPQIMCESMRDNDVRWLFVHAEELLCAVVALGVLLFWVVGSRGVPPLRRWAPLVILAACCGLLVVTEFAIDGKWFDFSHAVCYIFMTFVLAVMCFAGAWAARNWNRGAGVPAKAPGK